MFNNTLFDENAASHVAVGQSYTETIRGGQGMSKEQLAAAGANQSIVHEDWMIGSGELDIDGELPDGTREPLMRKGEWGAGGLEQRALPAGGLGFALGSAAHHRRAH